MPWKKNAINNIFSRPVTANITAQKMKFSITDFFNKYDQAAGTRGFGYIYWRNF